MKKLLDEFKDFINQGNIIELAVAFIFGLAVKALIDSLVNGVIMNVIAAIFGKPNFNDLTFTIGKGVIYYGAFLTQLVNFLIIAVVLFLMVKGYKALTAMKGPKAEAEAELSEKDVLVEIRDLLQQRNP